MTDVDPLKCMVVDDDHDGVAIAISAGFDYFVSKGDPPAILESILNGLAP